MKNLPEILEKHAAWLRGEEGGERADLSGADLFRAYLFRAYLSRADLSGADLYRADLSVADLSGAYLTRADLRGAYLTMADLRGANLSVADLRGADLTVANLTGANLTRANLTRANLTRANLTRADLSWADLSVADLSGANLSGAVGLPNIDPLDINSAVYEACSAPGALDMKAWHTCETTHCRAGWAVILHPQGRELEDRFGTNAAAALIYNACAGFVPDFYASNEDAIRDIAEKAGK